MSLLLAKRLPSLYLSSHPSFYQQALLTPQTHQPQKELPFIADYLISSFGFSPDRALKISARKNLASIKFPDQPNAVVQFLKDTGLSDAQIKPTIIKTPGLLSINVDNTLRPRFQELMAADFSHEIVAQLIRYRPRAILCRNVLPSLQFWRTFLSNSDDALLKLAKRCPSIFEHDVHKFVTPRINVLKEYGLLNQDIATVLLWRFRNFTANPDTLRRILQQTEELGFLRETRMFLRGLHVVGRMNKETFEEKVKFLKEGYGWSDNEVYSAFRAFPNMLACSKNKVKSAMDFLVKEAKMEIKIIAYNPVLLGYSVEKRFGYSVEKRLMPRHLVLSILKVKGLHRCSSSSIVKIFKMTEELFLQKFVRQYEEEVPHLAKLYGQCTQSDK